MHLDVRDLQYATFSQKLSAFDLFLMPSEYLIILRNK